MSLRQKHDSGQVESKPELHSRTSQSLPTRGASYTSGSQTGRVWTQEDSKNSGFPRVRAGPVSKLSQHRPLPASLVPTQDQQVSHQCRAITRAEPKRLSGATGHLHSSLPFPWSSFSSVSVFEGAWLTTQLVFFCVRSSCVFMETCLPCALARSHTAPFYLALRAPAATSTWLPWGPPDSGNTDQRWSTGKHAGVDTSSVPKGRLGW